MIIIKEYSKPQQHYFLQ